MNTQIFLTLLIAFALIFRTHIVNAQQTTISGSVTIFNSRTDFGKTRYISGATIEDRYKRAQTTITDNNGNFKLFYYNVNIGKEVTFEVIKQGWQVVNTEALSVAANQLDTVKISMAKPTQILTYRRQLYHTGLTESEKRLTFLIKRDDDSLTKLLSQNANNSAIIDSLRREVSVFRHQKDQSGELASEFADRYVSVDLDYASPPFLSALNLFKHGQIDSALQIIRTADPRAKIISTQKEADSLAVAESRIHEDKIIKLREHRDAILELGLKADLHFYKLQFDSALECYRTLIIYDSNNSKNYFETAFLYNYFLKPDSAIRYYQLSISHSATPYSKISALNNLSDLFQQRENTSLAFICLQTADSLYESLKNPSSLDSGIHAMTLATTASFYTKTFKYDSAQFFDQQAFEIYLHINDSDLMLRGQIKVERNLGVLLSHSANYAKAISYYLDAFQKEKLLIESNVGMNGPDMVKIMLTLSTLYMAAGQYKNAQNLLDTLQHQYHVSESLKRHLANNSQVASIEYTLGNLAESTDKYVEAKTLFENALNYYAEVYRKYPDYFFYEYIRTLLNLAEACQSLHLSDTAKILTEKAIYTINEHRETHSGGLSYEHAAALHKLAMNLFGENDFDPAIKFERQAISEYDSMSGNNFQIFVYAKINSLSLLGTIYYYDDQYENAIKNIHQAIFLLKFVPFPHEEVFYEHKESLYNNIGKCFDDMRSLDSSSFYLDSAKALCLKLDRNGLFYQDRLATVNISLGDLSADRRDFLSAKNRYLDAYRYYEIACHRDSLEYEPLLSSAENNLGNCYQHIRTDSAEYFWLLAYALRLRYCQLNLKKYGPDFAMVCNNLGHLYATKYPAPDLSKMNDYFLQGYQTYNQLDLLYLHQYDSALVVSGTGLAVAQGTMGKYDDAKTVVIHLIQICDFGDEKHKLFYAENLQNLTSMLAEINKRLNGNP